MQLHICYGVAIDSLPYRPRRSCLPPQATLNITNLAIRPSLHLHHPGPVMRDTHPKPNPFLRNATKFLLLRRKPTSPSNLIQGAPSPPPNPQWQTLFFTSLPPELRILIYHELARDAPFVVHILKKTKKKIEFVKCYGERCEMIYNYQCQPNSRGSGATDRMSLLPFLLSCRKGYVTPSSHL